MEYHGYTLSQRLAYVAIVGLIFTAGVITGITIAHPPFSRTPPTDIVLMEAKSSGTVTADTIRISEITNESVDRAFGVNWKPWVQLTMENRKYCGKASTWICNIYLDIEGQSSNWRTDGFNLVREPQGPSVNFAYGVNHVSVSPDAQSSMMTLDSEIDRALLWKAVQEWHALQVMWGPSVSRRKVGRQ